MKDYFEYFLFKILLNSTRVLSVKIVYRLSIFITSFTYSKKPSRVERVKRHLKIAFNTFTEEEIDRYYAQFIEHIGSFYAELILMATNRLDFDNAVVNKEEAKKKVSRLKNRGERGLILLVSHYGNWEFLGHWLAKEGLYGAVVAREFKNKIINEKFIIPFRTMYGNRSIDRKGAIVSVAKELKEGGGVALLIDQMIPPPNGIKIKFFGKDAYTLKSAAQLKYKFDPLVVAVFAQRVGIGKFKIIINEPVENECNNLSKDNCIKELTQIYTNELEKQIKKSPPQWQWNYRRWREP